MGVRVPPFALPARTCEATKATEFSHNDHKVHQEQTHTSCSPCSQWPRHRVLRGVNRMKTEFTDVSETQKTLTIEIPSEIDDAETARMAKGYSKQAKIPGFRPGTVPATIIKQRLKHQILHYVMHG